MITSLACASKQVKTEKIPFGAYKCVVIFIISGIFVFT
jgi:hypothetical protein